MDCKAPLLMSLQLLSLVSCDVLDLHNTTKHTLSLDLNEDFKVAWYTDNQKQLITFEVTVRTTGWIGLGFSPAGGMKGADIIICGVNEAGDVYLEDRFAPEIGYPVTDDSQDVELISSSEEDGTTSISFSRSLTNCDRQDLDIIADTTRMIFAWGATDELSKHMDSQRGQKSVYLFDEPKPKSYESEHILTHDFVFESSSRSNSSAAPLDVNQDGRLFPEISHPCGECCSGYTRLLQEREYQALEISRGEVYIAKLEEELTQFKEKAEKRDKQERNKKRFRVHLVHKENVQDFPQRDTIRTKIARKLGMSNVNQTFS